MEVLLLTDITGVGKKNDLIVVRSGYALNHLLPSRKALVVTPNVRKRYADQIKKRALEREQEKSIQSSLSIALTNKTVHLSAKATKTGKLYAAISAEEIMEAMQKELSTSVPVTAIQIGEHIKTVGKHTVQIVVGAQSVPFVIEVKAIEEK